MTQPEALQEARDILAAIARALDVPRNRFGKLDFQPLASEPIRKLAVKYGISGCVDVPEQCVKVARASEAAFAAADQKFNGIASKG